MKMFRCIYTIDDGIYEFENDNFFPLLELPRPELAKAKRQVVSKNAQKEKKIERLNYNEALTADTFLMQQIIAQLAQIKEGVADIGQKLDSYHIKGDIRKIHRYDQYC